MTSPLSPFEVAARLAGKRGRVLLHSGRDDDALGTWSFATAMPSAAILARGRSIVRLDAAGRAVHRFTADPFDAAEAFLAEHGCTTAFGAAATGAATTGVGATSTTAFGTAATGAAATGAATTGARATSMTAFGAAATGAATTGAPATGAATTGAPATIAPAAGAATNAPGPVPRVIGYFGYDLARVIETLPGGPTLGTDTPDLWLAAYDGVARWGGGADHYELVGPDPSALAAAIAAGSRVPGLPPRLGPLRADDDGGHHMARVERIRDYLTAGDVYQVNLARRHVARITSPGDPLALYRALADVAPAPYGALIEADGLALLSGSPERFLASTGDRIETRPIKGTRPLGPGGAEELAAAAKDAAEHLMIVDLERNDLGRIAETGSVQVDRLGYVVELPALFHKVSRVSARLRAGVGYAELLRATFPGGSITGAPKVRAMQLIDELEPARRGPYCGAFGYFAPGGFDLAIAIRIGVIKGYELRVHVGGGIVADSDPAAELAETETKAAGWVAALARLR